jgi:hypothetical protein
VGLPVREAAEVTPLHHVHATAIVGLLVEDPPGGQGNRGSGDAQMPHSARDSFARLLPLPHSGEHQWLLLSDSATAVWVGGTQRRVPRIRHIFKMTNSWHSTWMHSTVITTLRHSCLCRRHLGNRSVLSIRPASTIRFPHVCSAMLGTEDAQDGHRPWSPGVAHRLQRRMGQSCQDTRIPSGIPSLFPPPGN